MERFGPAGTRCRATSRSRGSRPVRLVALFGAAVLVLVSCVMNAHSIESGFLLQLERQHRGIPILRLDEDLNVKAQAHAEWMATTQQLTHSNLSAGVPGGWRYLAENVGRGYSIGSIHDALVLSSSHFAHMIDRRFSAFGVGAAKGTDGRYYVVQVFMG
ncbi:MAG: CAP domain-containing protein [Actinobacteria bacterium]|nr:MAG: CAP domain-containing protein [Actinomycetota bacterium]RIK07652.1 MAG: hypothetical protein DCC48_03945 [Acidobacteriota bacterium]